MHLAQAKRYAENKCRGESSSSRQAVHFLRQQERQREWWLQDCCHSESESNHLSEKDDQSDNGFFCGKPSDRGSFTPLGGRVDHTAKAPEKVLSCKGKNPKETLSGPSPPIGKAWFGRNSSHPWQIDPRKAGDKQASSTICPSVPTVASVVTGKLSVTGS